ncbi:DNA-directed RNA polymerase specialized sigma24 family protein [Deinococcus metalli]|uniref:DNA-directed RNA polymerase specialized sigma24 family protein n=1 Tax=Deinococcus metalli TaxID=1141878 RepID=A0A7W8KKB5_9DEIO|nr:hypothetical protein [Deinococcus metalli]MBB5378119.1 DNA-directed RNA polymerase specialized sigma24 family protein [Deinococcus metalli]
MLCALADRDEDALRELHRRYARAVYALALKSDRVNPEAAVQLAFLTMMRRAGDQPRSLLGARAWVLGVACWTLSRSLDA